MAPRSKITKEGIVEAAIEAVRENGVEALNARSLAARLGCSTQPIFSNFASMDELRTALISEAVSIYDGYTARIVETGKYPSYKASGIAYIGFAGEEKELFKLLYMSKKEKTKAPALTKNWERSVTLAGNTAGLESEKAELFHLEMWVFVHGIATMVATDSLQLDSELVSEMLTDAYIGLSERFTGGKK